MLPVAEALNPEFEWKQPSVHRWEHQLCAGGRMIARLKWRSGWGTLATAETDEGVWEFSRCNFFNMCATIRRPGLETDEGMFTADFTGRGCLALAGGREFKWRNTHFWLTAWQWTTLEGAPLIVFNPPASFNLKQQLRVEGRMNVVSAQLRPSEQSLLAAFGWYLVLLIMHDASLAAVAA